VMGQFYLFGTSPSTLDRYGRHEYTPPLCERGWRQAPRDRTLPTDASVIVKEEGLGPPPARRWPLAVREGRQNEHTMDALALRAEEGRGTAPICLGEPLAGPDPRISE
jgi:hypothetical protein